MKKLVTPAALAAVISLAGCVPGEQVQTETAGVGIMTSELRKFHAAKCGPHSISMYGVPKISLAALDGNPSGNQRSADFAILLEIQSSENMKSVEYKVLDMNYYGKVEATRITSGGQRDVFFENPSEISGASVTSDQWSEAKHDRSGKAFVLETWRVDHFFSGVTLVPGVYRWREKPVGTVRINGTEECQFPMGVYEFTITP